MLSMPVLYHQDNLKVFMSGITVTILEALLDMGGCFVNARFWLQNFTENFWSNHEIIPAFLKDYLNA